jgi:predicted DNA-binding transcriptional regulator AlpA
MYGKLAGVAEAAELLGVSKQRLVDLARDPRFPRPEDILASGPVWRRAAIEQVDFVTTPRRGRPPLEDVRGLRVFRIRMRVRFKAYPPITVDRQDAFRRSIESLSSHGGRVMPRVHWQPNRTALVEMGCGGESIEDVVPTVEEIIRRRANYHGHLMEDEIQFVVGDELGTY